MKWLLSIFALLLVVGLGGWAFHGVSRDSHANAVSAKPTDPVGIAPSSAAVQAPADKTGGIKGPARDTSRIIATDGALTEIVYALGFGEKIAAADVTAQWPDSVRRKPSIGYVRRLSAEGILSIKPTLILNNEEAGPPEVILQLRGSGVEIMDIPGAKQSREFPILLQRIRAVSTALGVPEKGRELTELIEADLEAVRRAIANPSKQKALFLFNPSADKLTAGGKGTGGDVFFKLVGLQNVAGELDGWKPFSTESVMNSAPDIIVASLHTQGDADSVEALLKIPGIAQTPAGKTKRILFVDGGKFLIGGPRIGQTALEFAHFVYPDADLPKSKSETLLHKIESQNQ